MKAFALLNRVLSQKNLYLKPLKRYYEISQCASIDKSILKENHMDSETYLKNMGTQNDYEAKILINKGACADVYEGVHLATNEKIIIKVILTSTIMNKFIPKKELIFLNLLKNPNIVEIKDYFIEEESGLLCLVLKYFPNEYSFHNENLQFFSPKDIKIYMKQLLEVLKYCHSKNVYHLDVKPHNILVDIKTKQLKLIDFGSADYFIPQKENRINVYSRFMKPPEILLGNTFYNLTADIWAVGAIFAALIFNKEPFFEGSNIINQLLSINQIVGTESLLNYISKYNLDVDQSLGNQLKKNYKKKLSLSEFILNKNKNYVSNESIDLIQRMLVVDQNQRISAKDALDHPYFKTQ